MNQLVTYFKTCYVCGADVLAGEDEKLASCSTHSKADRRSALNRLQAEIDQERSKL
jgi:hypothetical protein